MVIPSSSLALNEQHFPSILVPRLIFQLILEPYIYPCPFNGHCHPLAHIDCNNCSNFSSQRYVNPIFLRTMLNCWCLAKHSSRQTRTSSRGERPGAPHCLALVFGSKQSPQCSLPFTYTVVRSLHFPVIHLLHRRHVTIDYLKNDDDKSFRVIHVELCLIG